MSDSHDQSSTAFSFSNYLEKELNDAIKKLSQADELSSEQVKTLEGKLIHLLTIRHSQKTWTWENQRRTRARVGQRFEPQRQQGY
jgi:flagellar hook-basal body complex protein FliE